MPRGHEHAHVDWKDIIAKAKAAYEEWLRQHSGSHSGSGSGSGNGNGSGGGSGSGGGGSGSGSGGGGSGEGSGGGSGSGSGSGSGGGGSGSGGGGSGSSSGGGGSGGSPNTTSHSSHGVSTTKTTPTAPGGTATHTTPSGSLTASATATSTLSSTTSNPTPPIQTPGQVAASRDNVARIVVPIVLVALLFLALVAFLVYRRQRGRRAIRLGSTPDVSFIPTLPPPRPSPFASFAARLRGGAPSTPIVPPLMVQQPSDGSRPQSFASTVAGPVFETRHPFASPMHGYNSDYGGSIAFGGGASSYAAAHGHSGSGSFSGQGMPFPHSTSSPSLPAHSGIYGHRYGASASGSIVGSGVFSIASAHAGHGPGITPGNELSNPFNDPAPLRPYSVAGTDESSRSESQLGRRSTLFVADPDAPPVPPKPTPLPVPASPMSPETPGSAHPLLGRREPELAYLSEELAPDAGAEDAIVQHARTGSLSSAALIAAPPKQ